MHKIILSSGRTGLADTNLEPLKCSIFILLLFTSKMLAEIYKLQCVPSVN